MAVEMSDAKKEINAYREKLRAGGPAKYHEKLPEAKKLFVRKRLELLLDAGSLCEDGLFANCGEAELAADGVVTGLGKISGRTVAFMANDSTVKAGSWGARTVEKILRVQETAEKLEVPILYLVDSAGARITDQIEMFPGRRGAGRIFRNQATLSGRIPQICLLFGPSAAGGAYIPAFCDVVVLVEGNASMYLGSPRMAEAVIGEKVTLEEMGGARMHCSVSGCGDFLAATEEEAIATAKKYLSYFPQNYRHKAAAIAAKTPARPGSDLQAIIPTSETRAYDMKQVIDTLIDNGTFLEVKALYAKEVLTGFARLNGETIGIVANQPLVKGGVLFVDSSDKAARFVQLCNAFQIPLLFLADVPGFMIGSKVEKEGMIRAGAKMIWAISNARVPKISVIVRKAFGAGLYAMCGPSFDTDAVIALPTAQVAVMGPEPAVNAVYYNKIVSLPEDARKAFVAEKIAEYRKDIDIYRQAGELILDDIVGFETLRDHLTQRFGYLRDRETTRERAPVILPM